MNSSQNCLRVKVFLFYFFYVRMRHTDVLRIIQSTLVVALLSCIFFFFCPVGNLEMDSQKNQFSVYCNILLF